MRCLLSGSLIVVLFGCTSEYRALQPVKGDFSSLQKVKPAFTVAMYHTQVDVVGNHFGGSLLVKKMPDSSTRLVFSNEMGFKFFDFAYSPNGEFKVYSII